MSERLTSYGHDGYTFDVWDTGPLDGPVVIALHGFPQRHTSWAQVAPRLADAGYRVLAPDQRGYSPGAQPREIEAYRLDRLAGDVLALADAAGATRFHLLGHDWGGIVGWYLGGFHPDRLHTLSVVSVPHLRAGAQAMRGSQALRSWYIAFFQLPRVPELVLRAGGGVVLHRLLGGTGASAGEREQAVALLSDPRTATTTINWYRALRLRDTPVPGPVEVPTLYVWSDRDTALGRRGADLTAQWVTGPYRFEVLEGVSHWIPEEKPETLAALVLNHLAEHGGAGRAGRPNIAG